jgi:hypothetical protein
MPVTGATGGRRFAFGDGSALVGADGAVVDVIDPRRGRSMLLREDPDSPEAVMHRPSRRWGKGFVIAGAHGYRFDAPSELSWRPDGVDLLHRCGPLRLSISRELGRQWTETYELRNVSARDLSLGSFAISTPWRDVYGSSGDSLRGAVHAHIWTGGADAWVWAIPMDGTGPGLGLQLLDGELWAYSVESRDQVTSSNVRGHLYLHVTDHARAPHAMGGQPALVLPAGGRYRLRWRLGWHADLDAFHASRSPSVELERCAAEVGDSLPVRLAGDAVAEASLPLTALRPGVRHVDVVRAGRRSRVSVLFHPPLRRLVETRVRFLLDRQRPVERADSRRHAFVPYDNHSGLHVLGGSWEDWSDGRERVGSALLLQQCLRRGWGDQAELAGALQGYHRFVTDHHVRPDGTVLDDAGTRERPRLYDFPWFARFLLDEGDLDLAARVMSRFYDLGGERFLAFELGAVVSDIAGALRAEGREDEAAALTAQLLGQARACLDDDLDIPAHEVNYEQSIVAPLLDLLLTAHRLDPALVSPAELVTRLDWLTAFAADQPDVRLRHMPIRHWDGYWFGSLRLWGDAFPHYWSILSAATYLAFPAELLPPGRARRLRQAGRAILRGNLASFGEDGSATCAFVYPSCVDGRPAYVADPLANDQDWALVYAVRLGLDDDALSPTG